MNSQRAGLRVAGTIFGLMGLVHVWRLIAHVDVRIGQCSIPMWASPVGIVVAGALSIWLWTLSKR